MEPFDRAKPNIARVWDYWLGGQAYFAADRELAEKMLAVHPPSAQMARENRQFLGRAVSYVAHHGVRQFIDVGPGLPTAVNTHDIAQGVTPQARVAYVDNDPIVISHARNLLGKHPQVIAVPGDMREPERVLADAELAALIDMAEPVCVVLSGVLHFTDAQTARDVAAAFAEAIVPGSYVIISVGTGDPSDGNKDGNKFADAYTAARIHIHSPEQVLSFFDGLEVVPPGVVMVQCWYGERSVEDLMHRTTNFIGGVARKPGS